MVFYCVLLWFIVFLVILGLWWEAPRVCHLWWEAPRVCHLWWEAPRVCHIWWEAPRVCHLPSFIVFYCVLSCFTMVYRVFCYFRHIIPQSIRAHLIPQSIRVSIFFKLGQGMFVQSFASLGSYFPKMRHYYFLAHFWTLV